MKKIISGMLVFAMLFSVVGCSEKTEETQDETKQEVVLEGKALEVATLISNIEQKYLAESDVWWNETAEFWHYVGVTGLSNVRAQGLVDSTYEMFDNGFDTDENSLASIYLRAILSLNATGFNSAEIFADEEKSSSIELANELANLDLETLKQGWFSTVAPYVLLALDAHDVSLDEEAYVAYLLEEAPLTLEGEWGPSVDSYAMILQGLSIYLGENDDVDALFDEAFVVLSEMQDENGSFGNANADAMAIVALSMVGVNADTDERFVKGENSLVDGLLSYTINSDGFEGYEAGLWDDYATKQGLIALHAYFIVETTGEAYNPFATVLENDAVYGAEAPLDVITPDETVSTEPNNSANTTVGDNENFDENGEYILSDSQVKIYFNFLNQGNSLYEDEFVAPGNFSVGDVINSILTWQGYEVTWDDTGYISKVSGNDIELYEFLDGAESGFIYTVNGKKPGVGAKDYAISSDDVIEFKYVTEFE